ncbi:MAG: hypothetical protein WBV53_07270, partial [Solirubrobacterales bacterium]
GTQDREAALGSYAEFVDAHEWKFRWMLRAQKMLPKLSPRMQRSVIRACGRKRFVDWAFRHYLKIAPPPPGRPILERRAKPVPTYAERPPVAATDGEAV